MRGTVKKLTDKGFGFITVPGRSKDLFFHVRNLNGVRFEDLREGDELEFDVEDGDKGEYAVNIEAIESSN